MTVFSNDIKDFLDTIYFYEIAHNTYPIDNLTPVHDFFLENLSTIESFPTRKHKLSTTFPFSRDKMFGVIFGRYEFGYLFDGNIVYVYGYRRKGNRSNDWLDSIIKESIYITQSDIHYIVESAVRKYLNRQILNEKFYNPATEPLIDGHVGEYEVLDGAEWEQILCDLPKKGWVEDIRMYSAMGKGGKTYCLYRRKDNGKYFFVEVFDDNKDDYLRVKQVRKNEVPIPIWNNAISLIRCR